MRTLELRRDRSYAPHEVGLETPLLFERLPLYLLVLPQDFAMKVSDLQTRLEWQAVKAQVSANCYDRATVPVWMVEGQLPNGFFSGVLRPYIRKNPSAIEITKDRPEFHLYLEQEGLLLQGMGVKDRDFPETITVMARQLVEGERKTEITPEFEADFDSVPLNLEGLSFIQFRNLL